MNDQTSQIRESKDTKKKANAVLQIWEETFKNRERRKYEIIQPYELISI